MKVQNYFESYVKNYLKTTYIPRVMDIHFSINNNEKILRMPYIPPDLDFGGTLNFETFENALGETLTLIGKPGLRTLTIESFFPVRYYSFLGDVSLANECIDFFNKNRKAIFRMVISSENINENMLCIVTDFKYSKKQNENIRYTLSIQEYISPKGGTTSASNKTNTR